MTTQCNELCKIARALNSTAISKYVTLKMTDVPSKHVWKIKESCYVYTTINRIIHFMSKTWEVFAQSSEPEAHVENVRQTKNTKQDKM